jgi:rhodanese-related sulfurtransferase
MDRNLHFENEIFSKLNLEQTKNLFFICRSGSRSLHAANSIQFHINKKLELKDKINCFNVRFGFEGDLSKDNRRGNLNGWKFSDLPWKQQ